MSYLLKDIAEHFKIKSFFLESLKQSSQAYLYTKGISNSRSLGTGICVSVQLPSTIELYKSSLSKNTRQNIRTAHNRLNKDGIDIKVIFNDLNVDKDKCFNIREERFLSKFEKISKLRKFKYTLMRKLTFQFKPFLPFYTYNKGQFLTTYDGEELCSFFYYIQDNEHRQILVLAAGVNTKYAKYSPGIISLYDFINEHIEKGDVEIIDFTCGNEKYKYSMGGKEQNIEGVSFMIDV